MSQVPVDQLARQLGVDEETAAKTAKAASAVLLGGMEANAQDPGGAASLEMALGQHDPALIEGGVDLGQVDTDDGAKIVRNVFGDNEDQIVNALGGQGGGLSSDLLKKALPLLAPLAMAFLAKSFSRGGGAGQGGTAGGGGLGDVLGGLLGGGGGGGGGGGLGDILGGLVGGGGGGGGLGDVLGGLLGGGKR